ncbi:ABC transporter permease [Neorhizobium sp. Rsf11]|uniref:ABC transporter permease n=2 Tax=Neorhizobium TaxID=1525371 RepID=A0ABV0MCE8_9HYPH|nr:ABC transporter permease [Neorhizobium petrolearium]MCC2613737.1 ABC transporter permease [Neorhizobium petrolearium]WGI72049.1 ABC transporter permease [Neorhizobium petrolearium]
MAIGQHLLLSVSSTLAALILAVLVGAMTVSRPRLHAAVMAIANLIYVIPSLAMFAILIPLVGLGFRPAFISLSAYAFLIILRNVETGFRSAPREILDAADGMGYSRRQRLLRVEFPLALPLIMSGFRLALVTSIGVATIAAFIGGGGLGTIILIGVNQEHMEKILVGSLLTALIALACDIGLSFAERMLLPWR